MTSERTLARIAGSLYLVVAVGELWLVAWLLVKGVPVPAPAPRAQALTG